MILNLSKIKGMKVLPISSVRQFAGQNFDALKVGKKLQAESVLSGSDRADGENVRVTLYLQHVETGEIIWTETFLTRRKTTPELEQAIARRGSFR